MPMRSVIPMGSGNLSPDQTTTNPKNNVSTELTILNFKAGKASLYILKREGVSFERLTGRDFCFQKKQDLYCPVLFENEILADNTNRNLKSSWEIARLSYKEAKLVFSNIYGIDKIGKIPFIIYLDEDDMDPSLRGRIYPLLNEIYDPKGRSEDVK
jgi:hypothetical protein